MSVPRRLVDLTVRSSVNGVVITDASLPDSPIVYMSPAFELMTEFSAEDLASRIENAVLQFQENGSRDDVAILVLREPE
jgi:PAS domain-containing protein